jgi:hypothetical protein
VLVVLIAAISLWQKGALVVSLTQEQDASWYLVRGAGITAYVL